MARTEADITWETVLGALQLQVPAHTFETMLKGSRGLEMAAGHLIVGIPNPFIAEWLEKRLYGVIQKTAAGVLKGPVDVQFSTGPALPSESSPEPRFYSKKANGYPNGASLNPKYTFDTFLVGECNGLAHAATLAAAERPGKGYNPLFLCSGVGLGKTHLLQAIAHKVRESNINFRYVTGEQFTNEFLQSLREGQADRFRERYRTLDMLLLDDVHFLIGKEQTQEGFFHTFNELHNRGSQIVLTCDRLPKELGPLEDRLRSRFQWGLIADLQPPALEMRLAILKVKLERSGIRLSEAILELIAKRVSTNVRELEGALNRLVALVELTGQPVAIEQAERLLADFCTSRPLSSVGAEKVLSLVAQRYSVSPEGIKGKDMTRNVSRARRVTIYLLHDYLGHSLVEIGRLLGGRDRSTIHHALRKIALEMAPLSQFQDEIRQAREELDTLRRSA
ncbi:MAG: chromosomal replication initiator protein DnaA [Chloroflexi bacterium]|nr:chromosomal replication initiator protein DnaA [Chloroflexota bacterium]